MQPNCKSGAAWLAGYSASVALGVLATAGAYLGQVSVLLSDTPKRIFLAQELDDFRA